MRKKISLKILNMILFLVAGYLLFRVWSIPALAGASAYSILINSLQTIVGALLLAFMLVFIDNFLPPKKKKDK